MHFTPFVGDVKCFLRSIVKNLHIAAFRAFDFDVLDQASQEQAVAFFTSDLFQFFLLRPYCTAWMRVKSNSMTAPDDRVNRISIEYLPSPDIAGYLNMTVTTGVDNELETIISLVTSSPFLSDAVTSAPSISVPYGIDPSFAVSLDAAENVNVYGTVAEPGCKRTFPFVENKSGIFAPMSQVEGRR